MEYMFKTSAFNHVLCFNLERCTKKFSNLVNHPVVCSLSPEWAVHVLRWSPRGVAWGSNWNFLQSQVVKGFSVIAGIWDPIDVEKNVCQRLEDQDSSRRWDLICPSQLIGLKKRIHLGPSSSWDSSPDISIWRTDSSTVVTTHWCERKLNCSVRYESGNMSLRSWKGYQCLSICWVTLSWEGTTELLGTRS
jgi:hypothetical protein